MVCFPNGKINLGLHVLAQRPDGYHELETVLFPLTIHDVLEVLPADQWQWFQYGLPIAGLPNDNLVYRAWGLMQAEFPKMGMVAAHLYKHIPMGAGLGGGSSDGAFMLQALNSLFSLGLNQEALREFALRLGSDCPFFILNKPCIARGRGEILTPVDLNLNPFQFVLVHPGIPVRTGWAYSAIQPKKSADSVAEIIKEPISSWRRLLFNDFEKPVFRAFPQLEKIKQDLYAYGALYASMTGSGSTIFGIFEKKNPGRQKQFVQSYRSSMSVDILG